MAEWTLPPAAAVESVKWSVKCVSRVFLLCLVLLTDSQCSKYFISSKENNTVHFKGRVKTFEVQSLSEYFTIYRWLRTDIYGPDYMGEKTWHLFNGLNTHIRFNRCSHIPKGSLNRVNSGYFWIGEKNVFDKKKIILAICHVGHFSKLFLIIAQICHSG